MTDFYPYEKRPWYAHMGPEDRAVWERFIEAYPDSYQQCAYDVVIGRVPDFVLNDPDADQASMERLYRKRIDVVAIKNTSIDIVELKPKCTMSTVGQVKGYLHLYIKEMKPVSAPSAHIICASVDEDVREFARDEGVLITVV